MKGMRLVILASLLSVVHCVLPAPEGVKVFAFSFADLARETTVPGYYQVIATASQNAAVRVNFTAGSRNDYALLRSGNEYTYDLRSNSVGHEAPEGISSHGAVVVTQDTDDVYVGNIVRGSSDFFKALPLTKGSKQYYIPSYVSRTGVTLFSVTAAADTCIEVYTVSAGTFTIYTSFNLKYGETYTEYLNRDVTGLNIQSSQPVGVNSGHECAQVPDGVQYCDHLIEQIPPTDQWGIESIVPPVVGRRPGAGYILRILPSQDNTAVDFPYQANLVFMDAPHGCVCDSGGLRTMTFNLCTQPCLVSRGDYLEVDVADGSVPIMVRCDSPCLVTQYTKSYQFLPNEPLDSDAYTIIITPTDHYSKSATFHSPETLTRSGNVETFKSFTNYLSIILPTADKDGLQYNDNPVTQAGQAIGQYTVITLFDVPHGYHKVHHTDSSVVLAAFAYGHAPRVTNRDLISTTSYGLPLTYNIIGETLAGYWADSISVPPGVIDEDEITAAPRVCTAHTTQTLSSQTLFSQFIVQSDHFLASGCGFYINPRLYNMRDLINDAICQGTICPGVADDVFVTSLKQITTKDDDEEAVSIEVSLSSNKDLEISTMLQCRTHIINYIQRYQNWATLLSASDLKQCQDVITSLQKLSSAWVCLQ